MPTQLQYSRKRRKVDRESLIRRLKRHLDAKQPIRDEALLVGGLLDALLARYGASDRQLKRYEQSYLQLAQGLVQTIYEEARAGARPRLPLGLWIGDQGLLNGRLLIRYVVEQKMGWDVDEALAKKVTKPWFFRVGLRTLLRDKFHGSGDALRFAYPEHFFDPVHPTKRHLWHEWDFRHRAGMWRGKAGDALARQAIRHLIEVHEAWEVDKTLPQRASQRWFYKVGLKGMLGQKFHHSIGAALRFAYPEHYFNRAQPTSHHLWHPWDFSHSGMWSGRAGDELTQQAISHLIEVHEEWKLDQSLRKRATRAWFSQVGLAGMLTHKFRGSPGAALRFAYPDLFFDPKHPQRHVWHPWDFTPQGMWQGAAGDEWAKTAIRHMIEVHEGWKLDEALPRKATCTWFGNIGLIGMLSTKFNDSPILALQAAYPDHFFDPSDSTKTHAWHSWDFPYKRMWHGTAGDELAKQAIRHLIEVHEGWKLDETLPRKATADWFQEVGLSRVLAKFRGSPMRIIRAAYPQQFFDHAGPRKSHLWHDWDFRNRRRRWRGKAAEASAKQAIRHMIEVHEGWKPDETLPQKATRAWFKKVGLGGMLYARFRNARFAALRFAYPHLFGPKGRWPLGATASRLKRARRSLHWRR